MTLMKLFLMCLTSTYLNICPYHMTFLLKMLMFFMRIQKNLSLGGLLQQPTNILDFDLFPANEYYDYYYSNFDSE